MQKERAEYFRTEAENLLNALNEVISSFSENVNQHIIKLVNDYEEDYKRSILTFGSFVPNDLDQDICKAASKECSNIVLRFANLVFGYDNEHPLNILLKKALDIKFYFPSEISYENGEFSSKAMNPYSIGFSFQEDTSYIEHLIKEFINYLDSFILPFIDESSLEQPK